jgi:EamA domain-containing membrane protein RarD
MEERDRYIYIYPTKKLISAIFASIFLKEKLGPIGKIGCLLSVVGALIIVLHAPEDKEVTSIDELLFYALRPGTF